MACRLMAARTRHLLAWAIACLVLGAALGALQLRRHADSIDAAYRVAEADVAEAEQALLRAFDLAAGLHELLRIKHELLDASNSSAGIALEEHLRNAVANGRFGLVQLWLVDAHGEIAWSSLAGAARTPLADRSHIRIPLQDPAVSTYVSRPLIGRSSGRWSIQVSKAIREPGTGRPVAVGVVSLDPVMLSRALLRAASGEGRRVVVRRLDDGALLARSGDVEDRLSRPPDPDHPVVLAARQAPEGRAQYVSRRTGATMLAAYRVPQGIPVVVSALLERRVELRGYWLGVAATVVAYLAACGLGLRLALGLARRQETQRVLRQHAETDPLTGLLNRRAMERFAAGMLEESRSSGEALSVLLLDADHFKAINDDHGHDVGDRVLRDLSFTVAQVVRASDMACRWGGEEILVILRDCSGATARERAEHIRAAIEAMYGDGEGPVPTVTVSIGVAASPSDGMDLRRLVQAADAALYAAKRAGRNRVMLARATASGGPTVVDFPARAAG